MKTDGEEERRVSMRNNRRKKGRRGEERGGEGHMRGGERERQREILRCRIEREGARTEKRKMECTKQAVTEKGS